MWSWPEQSTEHTGVNTGGIGVLREGAEGPRSGSEASEDETPRATDPPQAGSRPLNPLVREDLLDGAREDFCDAKGQGKAGVVFARFNRIDGLTRHIQLAGEVGLCPIALGAERFEMVDQE